MTTNTIIINHKEKNKKAAYIKARIASKRRLRHRKRMRSLKKIVEWFKIPPLEIKLDNKKDDWKHSFLFHTKWFGIKNSPLPIIKTGC